MVLHSDLDLLEKLDRREEGCRKRGECMKMEASPKLSEDIVKCRHRCYGYCQADRKEKGRKSCV